MNFVSCQAAIGAFTAAALMLGANASADGASPHGALTIGAQLTLPHHGALADMLQTCRGKVLDVALDALGEFTARRKQL